MHQPTNKDIKVIKLINGDDIVCEMPTGENQLPDKSVLIRLHKPLQVRYVPQMTKKGIRDYIALTKWAAYTNDQVITIPKDKILTITQASQEMVKSWEHISRTYHIIRQPEEDEKVREEVRLSDAENEELNEIFDEFKDKITYH